VFARQMFDHLSHPYSPFCGRYILNRVSHLFLGHSVFLLFTRSALLGPQGPATMSSLFLIWGLANFLPSLALNCNPIISASQVPGNTDMKPLTGLKFPLLLRTPVM
jgi:hypothetical protein